LSKIAGEMVKAGMVEKAKEVFEQAIEIVERIKDVRKGVEALRGIEEEMAKAGMVEKAKEALKKAMETTEGIEDARERTWALSGIAVGMAETGEVEGAVGIVERETGMRTEMLPSVLEALAERAREGDVKSKEGFFRLLPLCGWSLKLAYRACGLLAWLYPEQVEEIAKIVSGE